MPKFFWLEVEDEEEEAPDNTEPVEEENEPEISLHAITGLQSTKTMQLCALVNEQPLLSLVDSGSTHNFISFNAAQKLQLPVQPRPAASVSVANGEKLRSYGISKAVLFSIEGHPFEAEFLIIPLVGFDMVLGITWMQALGPILWDFTALTMSFEMAGQKYTFQGNKTEIPSHLRVLQQQQPSAMNLKNLLEDYDEVFQEPKGLPPLRRCDHKISLKDSSDVVVVSPYRYPHLQKDEIEKQCK
ncbi:uncharacterized protein [Aristolochia californica]|uniref:uncharacterized protein n=1 Tax=Aristolochia californica TaxID=171875 RepID=UPI0035D71EBB